MQLWGINKVVRISYNNWIGLGLDDEDLCRLFKKYLGEEGQEVRILCKDGMIQIERTKND